MSRHTTQVNSLTASWLRSSANPGVLSGAGLWPLLAILAASAGEPGRSELAEAVGVAADEAMEAAHEVLSALVNVVGVEAAFGLWAQSAAQVSPDWLADLPPGSYGELTGDPSVDQSALDSWASERTSGLIEEFPVQSGRQVLLILATALALRTTWVQKFTDALMVPGNGAWKGRRLAGLSRTTAGLDDLRLAVTEAGALTVTRVAGDNGLDVHLILGEEGRPAGDVLTAAMPVVAGDIAATSGKEFLAGAGSGSWPGVRTVAAPEASLVVSTVRFNLTSEHDLLKHAGILGLTTVCIPGHGHFSRIGPVPLRVDEAKQSAVAIFTATGFEAAAVTAIGLRTVSMPVFNARAVAVKYDRPFGFLSVHRESGLVLFAGWVDSPDEFRRG